MEDKAARCSMYQRYVITLLDVDDSDLQPVRVVRGFDELAVGRGNIVDPLASFTAAVNQLRQVAEAAYRDMGRFTVQLWGHAFPKNGGTDPLCAELLLTVMDEDLVPAVSPVTEMLEEFCKTGPRVPCGRR